MYILPCKNCQGVWNSITLCYAPLLHAYILSTMSMQSYTLTLQLLSAALTHSLLHTLTPSLTLQLLSAASSGVSYLPHNGLQSGLKNMAVLLKKLS